jgi:[ribosomal protein S5]-alanine N-acetyltransferase
MIHHLGTNSIETVRLKLRRFEEKDAKEMFMNWSGDPEVCRYLSWGPHKDVEVSRKRIREWIHNYMYKDIYVWGIELKATNQLIGSISVEFSDEMNQSCEVGYCIGKEHWGRGIMTEALIAVMHYLFYEVGFCNIRAKHDIANVASGKVMQKAGMHYTSMEYNAGIRRDGSYYDCVVYSKDRTEDE